MVETASRITKDAVDTHLSYVRDVVTRRNPQGSHRDDAPHVLCGSEICKPTGRAYWVQNFNLFYHHGIWQSPMAPSKPPQRNEESLLLEISELVPCDALRNQLRQREREIDTDRDLRGPKFRYKPQRPGVPSAKQRPCPLYLPRFQLMPE